jgi:hypothetical protein
MQNWHTINAQRRRYINYSTALLNKALRDIRSDYKKIIVDLGDAGAALNSFSEANIRAKVQSVYEDIYTLTGVAFAKSAVAILQKSGRIQLKSDPAILQGEWVRYMTDFAKTKCGEKITSVTRNIYKDIEAITRAVISEGIEPGWGPARVADEIFNRVGKRDKWRALRIARTEVVGASNAGSYRGAGSFGIKLKKIWLVNLDSETRDDHAEMASADHIAYEDKWTVGQDEMLHPGDPDASVENVVNCRCAITYEPEQDIIADLLSGNFDPDNPEIY